MSFSTLGVSHRWYTEASDSMEDVGNAWVSKCNMAIGNQKQTQPTQKQASKQTRGRRLGWKGIALFSAALPIPTLCSLNFKHLNICSVSREKMDLLKLMLGPQGISWENRTAVLSRKTPSTASFTIKNLQIANSSYSKTPKQPVKNILLHIMLQ